VAIIIQKIAADVRTVTAGNLAFRARGDNVGVRGGAPLARRNGLGVAVAGKDFRARLQAEHRRRRSSTRQQMFITVVSGMEGQIAVGQDTFVQRLGYWTPRGFHVLLERAFVGRALVVRPTILPDGLVRVEVWPRFTTRSRRGAIDVTELKTTAVVRDGQSMVIGGLNTARDDVGTALFGVERDRRSSSMTMILTPQIGGMDIEWPEGLP
jgi:type II secretory pathway component GspD/PulD (secretin)